MAILTPFWSTDVGKMGDGYVVHHNRKFSWQLSGLKASQSSSKRPMKDWARWQFWSTTHEPSVLAFSINFSATGPWPWPNEMGATARSSVSAAWSTAPMGSDPGESTKTSGDVHTDSS